MGLNKDFLPWDTLYVTNTRAEVLAPRSRLTRQFWWWLLHQFWHNFECQNNSATTHAIISYLPGQPIVKIYCKLGFDPISYLVLYRIVLDTIKSLFLWRKWYFVQTLYCNPQLIFAKLWNQDPSMDHFVIQNSGDFLCWKYR